MRLSLVLLLVMGMALVVVVRPQLAQEQDDVRGAFLDSRPKEKPQPQNSSEPVKRPPRRPRPKPTPVSGSTPVVVVKPNANDKPTSVNKARIGLGITLFRRDTNGLAVRTDPSRVFRKGDRVRFLVETNTEGYIYVFNSTDNGPPVMVYPHAELDEGGNFLEAHVPFELPDSMAEPEAHRWLVFDEVAGNEQLIFVFSKQPIKGIPIEDQLVAYCKQQSSNCPWRPSDELWGQVQVNLKLPLQTDRTTKFGLSQTESEHQASTRGLGLAKEDPEPSMVLMASSNTSILVTSLDLIHK